jgi:hypothetical protein
MRRRVETTTPPDIPMATHVPHAAGFLAEFVTSCDVGRYV